MTSFGYWTPTDPKNGAGEKLIYLLVHKSPEAAAADFKASAPIQTGLPPRVPRSRRPAARSQCRME